MASYHLKNGVGEPVKCAHDPCRLHGGSDFQASNMEQAKVIAAQMVADMYSNVDVEGLSSKGDERHKKMAGTAGKYHINAKGDIEKCTATVRSCPYGATGHYDTPGEAKAAMEESFAKAAGNQSTSLSKKNNEPVYETMDSLKQEMDKFPALKAKIEGDRLVVHFNTAKAFRLAKWGVVWPDENGNDENDDIRQLYSDGITYWYDDYDGSRREVTPDEAKNILETPVEDPEKETAPRFSIGPRDQSLRQTLEKAMKYDYLRTTDDYDGPRVKIVWDFL